MRLSDRACGCVPPIRYGLAAFSRAHTRASRERGFTLVELLVALAVFSLMVLALLNLAGESVRTAIALEERALAATVAENQAVQAALLPARQLTEPASGKEQAGSREWRWERSTQPGGGDLLRVAIRVRGDAGDQVLAERELLRSLAP